MLINTSFSLLLILFVYSLMTSAAKEPPFFGFLLQISNSNSIESMSVCGCVFFVLVSRNWPGIQDEGGTLSSPVAYIADC